ncbi:MAG TPA: hypothetical protein VGR22_00275 [Thermomicrobiales bacterium]|nr:hypothetical protein [Thermomicrobiales bacterium]
MPDKRRDEEQLPPIPDGGLAESMPEWLRRPPAWRTLRDEEVVQAEPPETDEIPEADDSPIDPRTFLTDDDLPDWLRRLGSVSSPQPESGADERVAVAADERTEPEPSAAVSRPVASAHFVPRSPAVTHAEGDRKSLSPPARAPSMRRQTVIHRAAWWQGPQLEILLAVALLMALIVIVILVI